MTPGAVRSREMPEYDRWNMGYCMLSYFAVIDQSDVIIILRPFVLLKRDLYMPAHVHQIKFP